MVTSTIGLQELDSRRVLCEIEVTLDGRPAVIGGVRNQFATVATLDGTRSHQWSWESVRRVIRNKGGRFES